MTDELLIENKGAVRILTLNRPTKLNALSGALIHALTNALTDIQGDDTVSVVVLTGAGRAFCSGADISGFKHLTAETRRALVQHADAGIALTKLLTRVDKPIIAAVKGYALGAGCGLAFGADLVVAGESARFGYPELKLGIPATTVSAHVAHLAGRKIAFEMLALCENLTPQQAMAHGLINRIVPDAALMTEALGMAEKLAGWKPDALWQTKRTFQRAFALTPEQALEAARDVAVMMGRFPD
jgi:enoyl-CoA hydratase/carnithine racemase